jgi:hypothetical protein
MLHRNVRITEIFEILFHANDLGEKGKLLGRRRLSSNRGT